MKAENIDYTQHNKVAKEMGLKGTDGHYVTPLGVEIDTTASSPDRLSFGYVIAKKLGHITH